MTELSATNPVLSPIAIDAKAAAAMFGLSSRTWRRLNSSRQCPAPIRVGGSVRWRVDELKCWSECDCPSCTAWTWHRSGQPMQDRP